MQKLSSLDEIAIFFGNFSHTPIIVIVFVIGITLKELNLKFERRYFIEAIIVLLFSIIFNLALKYSFRIPLPEARFGKDAFAFPSGHMHSVVSFYGWLAFRYKSWRLNIVIGIIFLGVIFGMLRFEYHEIRDILGALFFGSILLATYNYLLKNHYKYIHYIISFASAFLVLYIYLIHQHIVITSAWLAFIGVNFMAMVMKKLYPN